MYQCAGTSCRHGVHSLSFGKVVRMSKKELIVENVWAGKILILHKALITPLYNFFIDTPYRDAQCTEKSVFHVFLSLISVYGQKNDSWTNLRIFFYSVRLLPDHIALSRLAVFRACRVNFFRLLPPTGRLPKSQDFSEFRLGNPVYMYDFICN